MVCDCPWYSQCSTLKKNVPRGQSAIKRVGSITKYYFPYTTLGNKIALSFSQFHNAILAPVVFMWKTYFALPPVYKNLH